MSDRATVVARVLEAFIEANRVLAGPRVMPFAGQDLSRSHLEMLFLIAHRESVTPGLLAAAMHITPGAVTQLVAKLRDADLVIATPTPTDSRSITFALTDEAQHELADYEARAVEQALPHCAGLTTPDLDRLAELLRVIAGRS